MSLKSDLEGEEFNKVTFVRMEDIQPARANQVTINYMKTLPNDKETCTENSIHYLDNASNIGSMVSTKSSTVLVEHDYSEKYIIPDSFPDIPLEKKLVKPQLKVPKDSWPTLEILPGGVIRHAEKQDDHTLSNYTLEESSLDKMYACARCSDSYRDLYSLVKHVKCHETDKKMGDHAKINVLENECDKIQQKRKKKLVPEKESITKKMPKRRKI